MYFMSYCMYPLHMYIHVHVCMFIYMYILYMYVFVYSGVYTCRSVEINSLLLKHYFCSPWFSPSLPPSLPPQPGSDSESYLPAYRRRLQERVSKTLKIFSQDWQIIIWQTNLNRALNARTYTHHWRNLIWGFSCTSANPPN